MVDNVNLIKDLINMGMNERNAKVYLALLKKKDASLPDLHRLSGVRLNKLYEVINNLIREGYCAERKIGRKRFFNVTDPGISIGSNLKKMEERLEDSYKLKNELEEIYHNTDDIKEPFEYIEVFHGNDNIHYNYCQFVNNSNQEILSFTKPPWSALSPEKIRMQGDVQKAFINRNGIEKSIYEISDIEDDKVLSILERDTEAGEQSKISKSLPIKMFIFDRKALLIADVSPISPANELRMALIKQQTIVNAFIALFDFFWQQSMEIGAWKAQQK
jgi:HTH-type transcriptional regulator, sugar sensing transcriptional regulator